MTIPVLYAPEAVADTGSFSPSAGKPKLVVDSWRKLYPEQIKVVRHGALSPMEISVAHDFSYVRGVLDCSKPNGFGTHDERVSRSLRYTTGGVSAACQYVLNEEVPVACAPYSGFHHAGWDHGGGFCTFNGLAIAALQSVASQKVESVLILDCDYHYGDGTQDILDRCPSDDTGFIRHWTAGEFFHQKYEADAFLLELATVLELHKNVGLIIYQAGADPHVNDPLGGFLTSKQLMVRDRIVFNHCYQYGIPIVWTLAGGYQSPVEKVVEIHNATLRTALSVFE